MYQFDKIKLVIWDLDETFWRGTLSEGDVVVPSQNRRLVARLTDIGIVNSICSKNDEKQVMQCLNDQGVREYFVFPSVNWQPKGERIKQLISDMQLRPANVLFLDDTPSNLGEAAFSCPDLMTGSPELITQLLADAEQAARKDLEHKRLRQYRLLEEKHHAREEFSSNEEFLYQSGIQVTVGTDCAAQLDRIYDLLLRANQLNFTKLRSSKEELSALFADSDATCGHVSVRDRFGDYGIIGFYAVKENRLLHFVFSCRTLGMGIEQYVYNKLGRPELTIVGEVISDLSAAELPGWINQSTAETPASKLEITDLAAHSVLVKGPCDLFQVYPYIANTELFDTEFTHTTESGLVVETTGHTTHVVEALRLSQAQKELVVSEVPFASMDMYCDNIYRRSYQVVFLSILADCNLGVYRRRGTGERLAFLEYIHPITDPASWPGLISGAYPTSNFRFTEELLRDFSEKYEFIGRNTPEQIVSNLEYIREHLAKDCVLAIMLGGELPYEKNKFEAYMDRHLVHKRVNDAVRSWARGRENIRLMDVNKYLVDQRSFYDHFNHYIKPVYYALASEMVEIVNQATGRKIRETTKAKMLVIRLKELLAPVYYKLRGRSAQ